MCVCVDVCVCWCVCVLMCVCVFRFWTLVDFHLHRCECPHLHPRNWCHRLYRALWTLFRVLSWMVESNQCPRFRYTVHTQGTHVCYTHWHIYIYVLLHPRTYILVCTHTHIQKHMYVTHTCTHVCTQRNTVCTETHEEHTHWRTRRTYAKNTQRKHTKNTRTTHTPLVITSVRCTANDSVAALASVASFLKPIQCLAHHWSFKGIPSILSCPTSHPDPSLASELKALPCV